LKKVFILSISSDIGTNLAKDYLLRGWKVVGTYRDSNAVKRLEEDLPGAVLMHCDISSSESIRSCLDSLPSDFAWDIFISLPCNPLPLTSFYSSDITEWIDSFALNSLKQLEFLHGIYAKRNKLGEYPTIVFTAGGGTNGAVGDFSAYTSAKIHLIKMMELLAYEDPNSKYVIIGPGWTNTKTHQITLANTAPDSKRHRDVDGFLRDSSKGTTFDEIIGCLDWIYSLPLETVSGRNFSVVSDNWTGEIEPHLIEMLNKDSNIFKLRRYGNDVFQPRIR